MATFAVGDIHGQISPLIEVLQAIALEVSAADTVVFLGDYIDRGRESKACVDAILRFSDATPADVVCLLGNHEEWMLEALADPTEHSWLLGMDGLITVRSYSSAAARAIHAASRANPAGVNDGTVALPYEQFVAAMPAAHRRFFHSLRISHETPDCFCSHGGVDPRAGVSGSSPRSLVWGGPRFPARYDGEHTLVYGHHDNAEVGPDGWPRARIMGRTYGVDTISHGVLTAIRLPGPRFYQSGRYERRVD